MFVRDPCGVACLIFTYLAIIYADYVVIRWIVLHTQYNSLWGTFNAVVFNTLLLMSSIAHFKAVFSDPGIIPLPMNRIDFSDMHSDGCNNIDWTICTRCETYRPPRAHHCRICKRCIRRMDHHCPWINNCVGERNQKYFIQFLLYIGILAIYSIALLIYTFIDNCAECNEDVPTKQKRMMHYIILLLESSLFGLFVSAILVDQFSSIVSDETGVEQAQKQGPYRPRKPKMALLSEVCGRTHWLMWFLPCGSAPRKFDPLLMNYHV